jgi:hypothetical protein
MIQTWVLQTICLLPVAGPPEVEKHQAWRLIPQLADDSFDVRARAARKLSMLGQSAIPAVRAGTCHAEPAIRAACRTLLARLLAAHRKTRLEAFLKIKEGEGTDLPCWPAFALLAGNKASSREYYAGVYRQHADFLDAAAADNEAGLKALRKGCTDLRIRLITGKEETVEDALVAVLAAVANRKKADRPAVDSVLAALETITFQGRSNILISELLEDDFFVVIVGRFLKGLNDPKSLPVRLRLAKAFIRPDIEDWALNIALDRKAAGAARGAALLMLSEVGTEQAEKIEKLLDDSTPVGTRKLGKTLLKTEVRDVALAALATLWTWEKVDLARLGFPYPTAIPGLESFPDPGCLGFATAAQRKAAFDKWKKRSSKDFLDKE